MKLYTREQMIEAFNYGKTLEGFDWIGDMIDSLEALELPSDEEIHNSSPHQISESNSSWDIGFHNGWKDGAKWMRDKIQGYNL
jgi:hypothetical protein